MLKHLIVITILGVFAAIATPNFKCGRSFAVEIGCRNWIKTLTGAVEMQPFDKSWARRPVNAGLIAELKAGGFLQTSPYDNPLSRCRYLSTEKEPSRIFCSLHGTLDDIAVTCSRRHYTPLEEKAQILIGLTAIAYALYLCWSYLPGARKITPVCGGTL